MAYSATVTEAKAGARVGRRYWVYTIAETEAATGSEFSVGPLPQIVTIRSYEATLTAGTGTTLNPQIGNAAGFTVSTQAHIATNTTTAAHINDQAETRAYLPTGLLYCRSNCDDLTADHTIGTAIMVVEGWDD